MDCRPPLCLSSALHHCNALHQPARQNLRLALPCLALPYLFTATTTNNTDVFERHIHSFLLLRVLVIGACPCSIVLHRPAVEGLFSLSPRQDCCLHSIYVSSHKSPTKNYSVRTSTSLMTPRTTSVSSSVPLSSLGRCACGGWGVSR